MERSILIINWRDTLSRYLPRWTKTLLQAMTVSERIAIAALALLLLSSGVLSLFNLIQQKTKVIPQAGGIYREAAVGQPRYLNPILASANDLDVDLTHLIFSGLFKFDRDLNLQNDLATGYTISDDQLQYTVTLRQDVRWHDGEAFNADDVVFTIRSIQTPDFGSPLAPSFKGVKVEKVDDYTVHFTLTKPYAPFLSSLDVGLIAEHVWSAIEPANATLTEQVLKPIGTGPFKFVEISTRRKTGDITTFRLARNDQYYNDTSYLDEIIFTFYNTHEEAAQALLTGKADGIGFLPLPLLSQIQQSRSHQIHRLLIPQYFAVFFNQQKNPALQEAGVRSALALATDRTALVTGALQSQGQPLRLPIPPPAYGTDQSTILSVNLEAARQNLSESGWEDSDNDGIRDKKGKRLEFTLTTTDWPEYIKTAELLKEQWAAIGVAVNLKHLGAGTIQQTVVQPRDYEALLFGELLPADPDPYPFWHSTQIQSPGLNLSLFKDKTTDELLEKARQTFNPDQRAEMYREFQNKILEYNPAIILYRPFYLFAAANTVRGINSEYAPLPAGRFNNITEWHMRTQRVWK